MAAAVPHPAGPAARLEGVNRPELLPKAHTAAPSLFLACSFSLSLTLSNSLSPSHRPCVCAGPAAARLEGVNRPELLPKDANVPVIDVAGFLTASEVGGTDGLGFNRGWV
jgi:hypothetical protein